MAKKVVKERFYTPSANLNKLIELSNGNFKTIEEATGFFESICMAGLIIWQMSDEEQLEDNNTDILIDSLTALTYILI